MLQWYAATSQVPWLFLLSLWLFGFLGVAAAYAFWNARGLRLWLQPKSIRPAAGSPLEELPEQLLRSAPLPAAIFEGDALELEVGLDTAGGARGPAAISGSVGGTRIALATGVVPRAGWRQVVGVDRLRRGPLGAADWRISSSDFLGLFSIRKPCRDVEVGLVMPRFASLAGTQTTREVEASAAAPRTGSGTEVFGVREYRPGDSLRRIHWRSSARHGELVVREYEPPGVPMLLIAVDPAPPTTEIADQIARIAASEAWDCIRAGGRVTLWAPGREPTDSPRDLWALLEWLARYPDVPSGPSGYLQPRGDVVAVTAGDRGVPELANARAWIVGDAQVEVEVPLRRVGVSWPL